LALARALVPGLAGMSGMRYRTFLAYNAVGGIVWGTTFVLIGYGAGTSYAAVAKTVGVYSLAVLIAVVVAVVVFVVLGHRRARRKWGGAEVDGPGDSPSH
jgi:membrane protein DedA with SNARE-associated domain